jgi:uncharacterized protein (TIRG00374 family)
LPESPEAPRDRFSGILDVSRIKRGLVVFLVLSGLGFALLFIRAGSVEQVSRLGRLRPLFLVLTVSFSLLDMFLGGLRNHLFIREIRPEMSYWISFRANLSNVFMGAITPSQTGGSPAQVFVYYRNGLSIGEGLSIIVVNYLATVIFFIISAVFGLRVLSGLGSGTMLTLVAVAFGLFTLQLILFLFFLWKPEMVEGALRRICLWLMRTFRFAAGRIGRGFERLEDELYEFHGACRLFLRRKPGIFLGSFALTAVLYFNKFLLAWLVMRGLGIDGSLVEVLAVQALIVFILYFSPSPGGSGIAELSTGALMARMVPMARMGLFTALQRFFFLYLPAAIGAVIFLHALGRFAAEKAGGND